MHKIGDNMDYQDYPNTVLSILSTGVMVLDSRLYVISSNPACEQILGISTSKMHNRFFPDLNKDEYPCLCYTRDLDDWHEFIRRTQEEYAAWIDGVARECETLELRILPELCEQGKPVFVDTNISAETLKKIAEPGHVLVMLADPEISVRRFFERPDREKQFLYQLILEEPDTEKAIGVFLAKRLAPSSETNKYSPSKI